MRNENAIDRSRANVSDPPQSFSLDPYAGYSFRDKPILGLDGVINYIDSAARHLSQPMGTTFHIAAA